VPTLTNTVGPRQEFAETANGTQASASSFPDQCEEFESPSIPNRGIVLGLMASGLLWAVIILAARALRLWLR
jgi:hypothetical protein